MSFVSLMVRNYRIQNDQHSVLVDRWICYVDQYDAQREGPLIRSVTNADKHRVARGFAALRTAPVLFSSRHLNSMKGSELCRCFPGL